MNHRWPAGGLVAALHLALLAMLWLQRPSLPAAGGERRLMAVRPVSPPPPSRRQAPPLLRPRMPTFELPLITPLPFALEARANAVPTPATATPPVEPPRAALRLTLPPGDAASAAAARNPALSDPRSNTPRPTLEDRIADATGGAGAWVEEPVENHAQSVGALGEYRTVLRRGSTCMEVFRSRISDNNAFNSSVAPATVAMLGKPYRCK